MQIISLIAKTTYSVYYAVVDSFGHKTSSQLGRFSIKAKDEEELYSLLNCRVAELKEEKGLTMQVVKIEFAKR